MTHLEPAERARMRDLTAPCWWRGRPVWTGIRNDLERQAKAAEWGGDDAKAAELARLAKLADRKAREESLPARAK